MVHGKLSDINRIYVQKDQEHTSTGLKNVILTITGPAECRYDVRVGVTVTAV